MNRIFEYTTKMWTEKIHTIKVYIKINESKMYDTKIKFIQKICMPRKRIRVKCLQI